MSEHQHAFDGVSDDYLTWLWGSAYASGIATALLRLAGVDNQAAAQFGELQSRTLLSNPETRQSILDGIRSGPDEGEGIQVVPLKTES